MDREIKFRGKDAINGKWLYGYYYKSKYGFNKIITKDGKDRKIIADTQGQYTGLKDKNGQEIYEGDIVGFYPNYTNKPTGYKEGVVKFTDYRLVVDVHGLFYDAEEETDEGPYSWEVIGNIHENPKLI